jgi:diguanylate cyclase (GGDEF)-like protein
VIRGLYTSAMGMIVQEKRQANVSHNLANIETTSFKQQEIIAAASNRMNVLNRSNNPGNRLSSIGSMHFGTAIDDLYTDFQQGILQETKRPLDFAIEGEGFFTIQLPNGEHAYTRDGSFRLNAYGELTTKEGYLVLSDNGYLYEYHIRNERLDLSEKCNSLFGTKEMLDEASRLLKKHLSNIDLGQINTTIKLPVVNGEIKVFKAVNTSILDDMGKPSSIIGKLVDISEEVAEREALVTRSQIDGLTGLYNAFTVKEYITEAINNKDQHSLDAFILLDFDEFKMINDTHGHLVGNDILEQLGKIMKRTFRNSDIIGRMGGDEICAYIKSIPSIKTIREKCEAINTELNEAIEGVNASVSMGVALVREKDTYDNIFKKADLTVSGPGHYSFKFIPQLLIGNKYIGNLKSCQVEGFAWRRTCNGII